MITRRQFVFNTSVCLATGASVDSAFAFSVPQNQSTRKISVHDFGAVGDGLQDDTKAIQSSIDTVIKNGGGTVYFPKGKYLISKSGSMVLLKRPVNHCLKVDGDNVHLQLDKEATLKIADSQAGDGRITAIRIGDESGNLGNNFVLSGAGIIDANWRGQSSEPIETFHNQILHSSAIIVFGKIKHIKIQDVGITGSKGNAVFLAGFDVANKDRLQNFELFNVRISDCAEGIVWIDSDYVDVIDCHIDTYLQDGIEPARNCESYRIIGNTIKAAGYKNHAIDIYGGRNGIIKNNTIYNSGMNIGVGLRIDDKTENVIIQNNTLYDSSIFVGPAGKAVENIIITENKFYGSFTKSSAIRVYRLEEHAKISNIRITKNEIQNPETSAIRISKGCDNVFVDGNIITKCGAYADTDCIRNDSNNVTITNNTIKN